MVKTYFNLSPRGVKIGQPGAPTGSMRSMASLPSPPRRERAVLSEGATKLMQEGLIDAAPLSEDSNLFEDLLGITRKKQDDYIRDANVKATQIMGERAADRQAMANVALGPGSIYRHNALNDGTATAIDGRNIDLPQYPNNEAKGYNSPQMQGQIDIGRDVDTDIMRDAIGVPPPIRGNVLPPIEDVRSSIDKGSTYLNPDFLADIPDRLKGFLGNRVTQELLNNDPDARLAFMNQIGKEALPQPFEEVPQGSRVVGRTVDGGIETVLGADRAPPTPQQPTGLMQEANMIFPDDPESARDFVEKVRLKPNVAATPASAFAQGAAEADVEGLLKSRESYTAAQSQLRSIAQFRAGREQRSASGQPAFVTGPLAGKRAWVGDVINLMGGDSRQISLLGAVEAYDVMDAATKDMALTLVSSIEGLRGTNLALNLTQDAVANASRSQQGSKAVEAMMEATAKQQIASNIIYEKYARLGDVYAEGYPGLYEELRASDELFIGRAGPIVTTILSEGRGKTKSWRETIEEVEGAAIAQVSPEVKKKKIEQAISLMDGLTGSQFSLASMESFRAQRGDEDLKITLEEYIKDNPNDNAAQAAYIREYGQ